MLLFERYSSKHPEMSVFFTALVYHHFVWFCRQAFHLCCFLSLHDIAALSAEDQYEHDWLSEQSPWKILYLMVRWWRHKWFRGGGWWWQADIGRSVFLPNNITSSFLFCKFFYTVPQHEVGHAVAQLVEALRYKPEGRGLDSRWFHWNFSLT